MERTQAGRLIAAGLGWLEAIRLGITVTLDEIPVDEYLAMEAIQDARGKLEEENRE